MIPKSELGQLELDDGKGGFDVKAAQEHCRAAIEMHKKDMQRKYANDPEGIEIHKKKTLLPNNPSMTPEQAANWHKQNAKGLLDKDPFSPEQLTLVQKLGQYKKEQAVFDSIGRELHHATKKHGPFNSGHEGWAVIQEEVDELWEAVKRNSTNSANREAVQVAAMAVRFILDNK